MLSPSAQVWEKWMKPRSAPVWTVLAHAGIKPMPTNQGDPLQLTPRPGENTGFPPVRAPRALPGGLCRAAAVLASWSGFKKFPSH